MKLTYDILWFEDQFSAVGNGIRRLENFIAGKGLKLKIDRRESISEEDIHKLEERLEIYNPYDLMILDYDMGSDSLDGPEIARTLRKSIYTDMVFYSGGSPNKISKIIYEEKIQGVYIVHKTKLFDDISPLVADNIKKISSLNGARGMIMSEWSQIELQLRKFIVEHIRSLSDEERCKHEKEVFNRLLEKAKERLKFIEKYDSSEVYELLADSLKSEFDIIRRSLIGLIDTSVFNHDNVFHQMQRERNLLAHNEHEVNHDGSLSVIDPKGNETTYNISEFQELRKRLIHLHHNVSELAE